MNENVNTHYLDDPYYVVSENESEGGNWNIFSIVSVLTIVLSFLFGPTIKAYIVPEPPKIEVKAPIVPPIIFPQGLWFDCININYKTRKVRPNYENPICTDKNYITTMTKEGQ